MLLHAHYASQSTENIVIHTLDTDVMLIAIAVSSQISGNIFIHTGTKDKVRIISIEKDKNTSDTIFNQPSQSFFPNLYWASSHLLAMTPYVYFSNKGKVKPLKILLKNQIYMETFAEIGNILHPLLSNWKKSKNLFAICTTGKVETSIFSDTRCALRNKENWKQDASHLALTA